ncbi:hypothetical protein C8Q72DRAFT_792992 [Fomitopsis betulina]|nr:hypothetical protein C8Q72DRAFT_792992 [Fomitopsis betulina]
MSYVILGRAIKSEYLAIGTLAAAVGLGVFSTGGKKEAASASSGKSAIETIKETVKFNASSRAPHQLNVGFTRLAVRRSSCILQLIRVDSIKKFIEDAEKEAKH